jgi:hypothetical protein
MPAIPVRGLAHRYDTCVDNAHSKGRNPPTGTVAISMIGSRRLQPSGECKERPSADSERVNRLKRAFRFGRTTERMGQTRPPGKSANLSLQPTLYAGVVSKRLPVTRP